MGVQQFLAPAGSGSDYTSNGGRAVDYDEQVEPNGRVVRVPLSTVPSGFAAANSNVKRKRAEEARAGENTIRELNSMVSRCRRIRDLVALKGGGEVLDENDPRTGHLKSLLEKTKRLSEQLAELEKKAAA